MAQSREQRLFELDEETQKIDHLISRYETLLQVQMKSKENETLPKLIDRSRNGTLSMNTPLSHAHVASSTPRDSYIQSNSHIPVSTTEMKSNMVPTHCPSSIARNTSQRNLSENSSMNNGDLSKILMRKELQIERLSVFNDDPLRYPVWKDSFRSTMIELESDPREELDLLSKYLGPSSKSYTESIRAAHYNNPERALCAIWERLDQRFNCPEQTVYALKSKINSFPSLNEINQNNKSKLYELCDLLDEVNAYKSNPNFIQLMIFDSSEGVNLILNKLPPAIGRKWIPEVTSSRRKNNGAYPKFNEFIDFLRQVTIDYNDPSNEFLYARNVENVSSKKTQVNQSDGSIPITDTNSNLNYQNQTKCQIHKTGHSISECRTFNKMTYPEKCEIAKKNGLCFRCLTFGHVANSNKCLSCVVCDICNKKHVTAMHQIHQNDSIPQDISKSPDSVTNKFTSILGSRSCGKILPVKISVTSCPSVSFDAYAIIDDQSNKTLALPEVFDALGINSTPEKYVMHSCSGPRSMSGRRSFDMSVSASNGKTMHIGQVLECEYIPQDTSEIPIPELVRKHPHLENVSSFIPEFKNDIPIAFLIGRDVPEAHHVLDQVMSSDPNAPFAQRTPLGWVVIGELNDTSSLHPGSTQYVQVKFTHVSDSDEIFRTSYEDEKPGLSIEDRKFLDIMQTDYRKDSDGHWSAPLPFKDEIDVIQKSNYAQALSRAHGLDRSLKKNQVKRKHFFEFMKKVFDSGAAEKAPENSSHLQRWYLPLFGVYNPKKPGKIRGVFDSSAVYDGISLNSLLLQGPDMTNNLLGVLLRFRKDMFPVAADVEQMFYQFRVHDKHRDFLRFFWYEDNDFSKPLIEYRMCVHVFGNSPSPSVAAFGLRKTVENSPDNVKRFIEKDFYVDDGMTSSADKDEIIDLFKVTISELRQEGSIHLHKIVSSNREILQAFDQSELDSSLQEIDLSDISQSLPVHSSLGIPWDLETDSFLLNNQSLDSPKAFTRRSLLSCLNSMYDPLGFQSPVSISGKIILRDMVTDESWDDLLPDSFMKVWDLWQTNASKVKSRVPRMYLQSSLSQILEDKSAKFHVFSDASEKAIASVVYVTSDTCQNPGFVLGKAKLAPKATTIPRLELCSAVLACQLWRTVMEELGVPRHLATFYTDSRVTLGYINNETRRFHTYVANRVGQIRQISEPCQWIYVSTDKNPADTATRDCTSSMIGSIEQWLTGSKGIGVMQRSYKNQIKEYPLVDPDFDKEIRAVSCKNVLRNSLHYTSMEDRFTRFSSWLSLCRAFKLLRNYCSKFKENNSVRCIVQPNSMKSTETFIIMTVQHNVFSEEIKCIKTGHVIPKSSSISSLHPFLDEEDILRVGGRIGSSDEIFGKDFVHPVILPKDAYVSLLLVRHFHEQVKHQGRHLTEGALRSGGYWIMGAKNLISSYIHDCFTCRRFRGKFGEQLMADLPADRVTPSPPFSHIGVDVFGPWQVLSRKTRGGLANDKRWAVLFTCLTIRAVHIEVIEELSTSSFINAFRRFTSVRGPVKVVRSDRGTNFIGAESELKVEWKFNPPHSSHMGGVWERMIKTARDILDTLLSSRKTLTHEVLCTLMAEVSCIMNSRPIVPVFHDPSSPFVLTPNSLLWIKTDSDFSLDSEFGEKDIYRAHWKHVQVLTQSFWEHWKDEFLQQSSVQSRRIWKNEKENLKVGDLVLMKDDSSVRGNWPVGIVEQVFPSDDGLVRSVEVGVFKNGSHSVFTRPITELVPL